MESSKTPGNSEEHGGGGSESGWTTYIASSIQEIHKDDDGDAAAAAASDSGCESDDSMASDASSGPSHRQDLSCRSKKGILDFSPSKHVNAKCLSKGKEQIVKQRHAGRIRVEKAEAVVKAKSATSHVKGGSKSRKNN